MNENHHTKTKNLNICWWTEHPQDSRVAKEIQPFLESGSEHMPPQIPARDASLDLRQKNENNSRRRIGFSSRWKKGLWRHWGIEESRRWLGGHWQWNRWYVVQESCSRWRWFWEQCKVNMKDVLKFELLVLIEKNKPTNEKKLNLEMEKQFSKNAQLRDIKLLHFKKSK